MARKPPQAADKVHISNLTPGDGNIYVIQSPFGEAEVLLLKDDGESVTLEIKAGYLRNGNSRKGPKEQFTCPRAMVTFFEMVKAG